MAQKRGKQAPAKTKTQEVTVNSANASTQPTTPAAAVPTPTPAAAVPTPTPAAAVPTPTEAVPQDVTMSSANASPQPTMPAAAVRPAMELTMAEEGAPRSGDGLSTEREAASLPGQSWIERIQLGPEQPALTRTLLSKADRTKVPERALQAAQEPPLLQVVDGGAKVIPLTHFSRLHAAIVPLKHRYLSDVSDEDRQKAKLRSGSDKDHFCRASRCTGRDCAYQLVPTDACRVFMDHGLCTEPGCRYSHYFLVSEKVVKKSVTDVDHFRVSVMRSSLMAFKAHIAPWIVGIPTADRLDLLKLAKAAVDARSRSKEVAAKKYKAEAALIANVQKSKDAHSVLVAKALDAEERRQDNAKRLARLCGSRHEKEKHHREPEPPRKGHRSEPKSEPEYSDD